MKPLGQQFWPSQSREKTVALLFGHVLESICSDSENALVVSQLTQVTGEELDLLWRWNSPLPSRIDHCIHEYFVQNAERHPSKQAVVSWDGQLSYGQVDRLSHRIAAHLISCGVTVGTVIPLCFEKSIWTVVAAMAVLRAGGSLALTDPSQPEERLRTIISEVQAKHLMTSQLQIDLATRIASGAQLVVVGPHLLQHNDTEEEEQQVALPNVPASTILYIQFTSGSTGKPKGVLISHSHYVSGAIPRAQIVGYTSNSRVLDFPSYAFDVSFDCMFCTLAVGGTICEPSEQERLNDMNGAISRMHVNMVMMTPSVARILSPGVISSLDVLGLGGESVSASDVSVWGQQTRIIIAYGPSECTVGCTVNGTVDPSRKSPASIGKGVGGSIWIVDPDNHDRLVPIGAVGELLVEGAIVGDGYLNNPQLTSEVFIQDPQWLLAGSDNFPGRHGRLYKTGDLVKYDFDGSSNLVFSGRRDQQVKIRGQRVELGEIEYHLKSKLPSNVNVAAETIVPKGSNNDPVLVAFLAEEKQEEEKEGEDVSFSPTISESLPEVNEYLSSVLPRYMVPTTYIPLRSIPLLVSCKTDRKTLRLIGSKLAREDLAKFRVTPRAPDRPMTDMENLLSNFWKDVLLLGPSVKIGPQDDFFTLGGDSLKAMKMVSSLRKARISLTVGDVFSKPVLADMALNARQAEGDNFEQEADVRPFSLLPTDWTAEDARTKAAELCQVEKSSVEDVYPCSPLQEGFMALSAKVSGAYVAQRVVELPDAETTAKLQAAFDRIVSDQPVLRTRIIQVPGRGLMQAVIREPSSSCKNLTNGDLQTYLAHDREDPMELNKPLSRLAVISQRTSATKLSHYFVWTIHHALYDGWSMPLIVNRINEAYQGLETKSPTAYNAFIKAIVGGGSSNSSQAYWRRQLRGAIGRQFPVAPVPGYQARAQSLLEHYVPLSFKSVSSTTTIANAIRGAWALTAALYASCDDVVFGETLTGRNAAVPGIEDIEGPTITTVPIRIRINKQLTVSEYLRTILTQTGERIPHEHFGLQHIRRVSLDAREACDLRTGIVIHPPMDEEEEDEKKKKDDKKINPANGFIPADDVEAAKEALNFNSFGLMLVFSLDANGFLIMASFDSNLIDTNYMDNILHRFGYCVQEISKSPEKRLGELDILSDHYRDQDVLDAQSTKNSINSIAECGDEELARISNSVKNTWIVDPGDPERLLPPGAVGELLIQSTSRHGMEPIETIPSWLREISASSSSSSSSAEGDNNSDDVVVVDHKPVVYHTGRMGRYRNDGSIMLVKSSNDSQPAYEEKILADDTSDRDANKDKKMAKLWSRILGISEESIQPQSNFFDLGGDSIMAMRLVAEARMEKLKLSVAQVFLHRVFGIVASLAEEEEQEEETNDKEYIPFSLLSLTKRNTTLEGFISKVIQPNLSNSNWEINDIYPVRPLQKIAIDGTVHLPRYSSRYEAIYFDSPVNLIRLQKSCDELVARNEILRTVFVKDNNNEEDGNYLGVVLNSKTLSIPMEMYEIDTDIRQFVPEFCRLNAQMKIPLGSVFVKFFFVKSQKNDSGGCLIMRISHAQYDEICLPLLLQQLSSSYEEEDKDKSEEDEPPTTIPFTTHVQHILKNNLPKSIPYWRDLLKGSTMTTIPPPTSRPISSPKHYAISKEINITGRSNEVTVATLPTAAWALCLANRLSKRDIVFGEVVSGRNTELQLARAEPVMGPCWQYVPVRVRFEPWWTGLDLLQYIQHQHITSASYEGIGLSEMVKYGCIPEEFFNEQEQAKEPWFDSVVHQDVRHVESLPFKSTRAEMETIYPHEEPLREWKIQAFPGKKGDDEVLTIEVITVESWKKMANQLLGELEGAVKQLVIEPHSLLFEPRENYSSVNGLAAILSYLQSLFED